MQFCLIITSFLATLQTFPWNTEGRIWWRNKAFFMLKLKFWFLAKRGQISMINGKIHLEVGTQMVTDNKHLLPGLVFTYAEKTPGLFCYESFTRTSWPEHSRVVFALGLSLTCWWYPSLRPHLPYITIAQTVGILGANWISFWNEELSSNATICRVKMIW